MRKKIGTFLTEKGLISDVQKEEILRYSQKKGIRFGEAAMELNLITREKLFKIFGPSNSVDFFHLDPNFFPKQTRDWIPLDSILRFGALPLGVKKGYSLLSSKRVMNIGLLNPIEVQGQAEFNLLLQECRSQHELKEFRFFLIIPDQFLDVLQSIYQTPMEAIQERGDKMDRILSEFIKGLQ